MTYTKTIWEDEVLNGAERFDIMADDGTIISENVQIALRTPVATEGTPINAANLSKIENQLGLLTDIPSCRAYNDANIVIAHNSNTPVTFNSESWDTDEIHSITSNTSRLTCKTAGIYLLHACIIWADNATGERILNFRVNGSDFVSSERRASHGNAWMTLVDVAHLAVNDYVEIIAYQTSGGNLNIARQDTNRSPSFGMTWLRGSVS
jgi:hypothetical protein